MQFYSANNIPIIIDKNFSQNQYPKNDLEKKNFNEKYFFISMQLKIYYVRLDYTKYQKIIKIF